MRVAWHHNLANKSIKTLKRTKGIIATTSITLSAIGLYHINPDFSQVVDQIRDQMNDFSPRILEVGTSAFTRGFLPDFLAQQYRGEKMRPLRSLAMMLYGGLMGGFVNREFYDLQNNMLPDKDFLSMTKKIIIDQGNYCPFSITIFLIATNVVHKKPLNEFIDHWRSETTKIVPLSWAIWGCIFLPIIYNMPSDLMIYTANFFGVGWLAYLSNQSFDQAGRNTEPSRFQQLLNHRVF